MPAISGFPDAMSDVLSLVRMRGEFVCANTYSAPWSYAFRRPLAHFHIVERGSAWITLDGAAPVKIDSGDLAVLPLGAGHVLSSAPELPAKPIETAIQSEARREGSVFHLGGGARRHKWCAGNSLSPGCWPLACSLFCRR